MSDYLHIVRAECERHGLIPEYVRAIIEVESGGKQWACRYEPGFNYFEKPEFWANRLGQSVDTEMAQQKTSWGLMQIMGGTARHLSFAGYAPELCIPAVGIHYGCMYLARQLRKYGNYLDAIAAYNAGSVQMIGPKYANQLYVDNVLRHYSQIKSQKGE